jgi:hypothetical protein
MAAILDFKMAAMDMAVATYMAISLQPGYIEM